jgi:hypothetical protein
MRIGSRGRNSARRLGCSRFGKRPAWLVAILGILLLALAGCASMPCCPRSSAAPGWKAKLDSELPLLGHRNWILIADSAYPAQSREGIETVATGASQLEVVRAALDAIDTAPHVRAIVYLDSEMAHVPESEAPGIGAYRKEVKGLLANRGAQQKVVSLPHMELIAKLDEAAKTFNILVLKTDLTIPYTSVFLELDCGYWSGEAEAKMRKAMEAAAP